MSQDFRLLIENYKKLLNESKYPKVARIFRGLRPSIKTIAILTAANPHGQPKSNKFNKEINKELEIYLSQANFGFKKIKGNYGVNEPSFIVYNISLSDAIIIGKRYNQASIVYGEVVGGDNNNTHMNFRLIGTDSSKPLEYEKILGTSDVFINRNDTKEFYSEVGGVKFVIPFSEVIDNLVGPDGKVYKITKDYSKSKWDGGKVTSPEIEIDSSEDESNTYSDDQLKENSIFENYLNQLHNYQLNSCCQSSYHRRCRIKKLIKEYYRP